MNKSKILIVEDDSAIRNLLKTTLDVYNYDFKLVATGKDALMQFVSYSPDAVILDLGLPDIDGIDVIKSIRSFSSTPIIIVSARTEDKDKVKALDLGADDYLTKPFSVEEFLARIRALLRRSSISSENQTEENIYVNGNLKIDYSAGCVYVEDEEVHLTPIEYKILVLLSKNTGKVLTHNFILREVWGPGCFSETQSLRVFMVTLRKKIEKGGQKFIQTHIGVGYRMLKID